MTVQQVDSSIMYCPASFQKLFVLKPSRHQGQTNHKCLYFPLLTASSETQSISISETQFTFGLSLQNYQEQHRYNIPNNIPRDPKGIQISIRSLSLLNFPLFTFLEQQKGHKRSFYETQNTRTGAKLFPRAWRTEKDSICIFLRFKHLAGSSDKTPAMRTDVDSLKTWDDYLKSFEGETEILYYNTKITSGMGTLLLHEVDKILNKRLLLY